MVVNKLFKFLNHYIHSQFIIFLELKNISVMKEHRRIKREMKMTLNRCLRSWLEFVAYQRNHKPISISVWIRIHYLEKSVCILCHYQFFINKSYHIIKEKNVIWRSCSTRNKYFQKRKRFQYIQKTSFYPSNLM